MTAKNLRGTQTEKNLMKAFSGESQARNRYTFFASKARKEGYEQIAEMFEKTAANEKEHAEVFFKQLTGGMLEFTGTYPSGVIGTTAENLAAAAEGEYDEWEALYPEFGRVAEQEGFRHIAAIFRMIATVEKIHEKRFRALLKNVESNRVFTSDTKQDWECRECGYHHTGTSAPDQCPVCSHPQSFYELSEGRY